MFIDTHTHLYDEQFDGDRKQVIHKAIEAGVEKMLLPNCDLDSFSKMMQLSNDFPNACYPMLGLHPCYVFENYKEILNQLELKLTENKFIAIGEIGLDYYWDKTFITQQKDAFNMQIDWALGQDLPIAIHTRDSLGDGIKMVAAKQTGQLRGVFHCFGGTTDEAKAIINEGFFLGIGGVVTFKNSDLKQVLKSIPLEHIILETDAPYLAPMPYRGKRNESSYLPIIAAFLSDIYEVSISEIEKITTKNAQLLFRLSAAN